MLVDWMKNRYVRNQPHEQIQIRPTVDSSLRKQLMTQKEEIQELLECGANSCVIWKKGNPGSNLGSIVPHSQRHISWGHLVPHSHQTFHHFVENKVGILNHFFQAKKMGNHYPNSMSPLLKSRWVNNSQFDGAYWDVNGDVGDEIWNPPARRRAEQELRKKIESKSKSGSCNNN